MSLKYAYYYTLFFVVCSVFTSTLSIANDSLTDILNAINKLERKSEPKCYATASRLEDFMFGTPLDDNARFTKNILQKQFIERIWQGSSLLATNEQEDVILSSHIDKVISEFFNSKEESSGHWLLTFKEGESLIIHKDDKRQYASIAYSLRAILAVQQNNLLDFNSTLLPLSELAIERLKDGLDFFTLAALKVADNKAKLDNESMISVDNIALVWQTLSGVGSQEQKTQKQKNNKHQYEKIEPTLVQQMADKKLSAYAQYNKVNNQLFLRNLQVYFARVSWPQNKAESTQIINTFSDLMSVFSGELYKGAQQLAMSKNLRVISEKSVYSFAKKAIPHRVNEYEDVLFFPNLLKDEQIYLESYDMDAFRDAGVHWQYLTQAILSPNFDVYIEPDPFAAELIVENIAQYGVLLLRVAGYQAIALGDDRLKEEHLMLATKLIKERVVKHSKYKAESTKESLILSSGSTAVIQNSTEKASFVDSTSASGVDFEHKSSDWLNRQLRSFIKKDAATGIITIPPAFGGSGVGVEDINNDGYLDILLLGGRGNKLFINNQDGKFFDKTAQYNLQWNRAEDGHPGEVRQPLIADINNDGWQDIIITYVNDTHRVYKNIDGIKFKDVTVISKLGGEGKVGGPATLFDYDNDGDLDLYITYFGNYLRGDLPTLKRRNSNGGANQLFENKGGFIFKNVTANSGLDNTGWTQAVAHTDINNDGLQDIIVGNDFGVNGYYINNKNGQFTEISYQLSTDKPSYTMGIGISDLNADLMPDFYISNIVTMNKDETYILPNEDTKQKFNAEKLAFMKVIEANDLFLSSIKDNKQIYEVSHNVERGYSSTGWSWDADFFDYDLDGDDDLYVLNGMNEFNLYSSKNPYYRDSNDQIKQAYMPVSAKEENVFFENSSGKLNNVSKGSGLALLSNSRSASYFDKDNDGDLDIVINNYHESAVLFENQIASKNSKWLKVKLIGDPEKSVSLDAIGAKVIVSLPDGKKIWREVRSTDGYLSVHPKEQHFGLGTATSVDLEVYWPNGKTQVITQVSANQKVEIRL
ncbi:CRTAC1 family protein [Colwellia sp. RSH04]|uniref:CRTAC1 family protein n=1 Tax=Colwellia sp. RSH04 TaxID=2305464 RepID=UPI000E590D70|nr:CRTAC1 family protein [Colwellia sp. RSH04]RHW74892.1 CRTAC1 family protein [Colwellia sp. RSH04]